MLLVLALAWAVSMLLALILSTYLWMVHWCHLMPHGHVQFRADHLVLHRLQNTRFHFLPHCKARPRTASGCLHFRHAILSNMRVSTMSSRLSRVFSFLGLLAKGRD